MITYRTLTEQHEFELVTDMEMLVWHMDERTAITPHTLMVITHTGGHVLGAFAGERMVGCTVAFAMFGEARLWSHLAAVHPDYRRQGIGVQMKQEQRAWALERGYTYMSWSFDPLMAANAHFNFRLLGVQTGTFHINFYGDMNDGINAGLPSDRFEVLWALQGQPRPQVPSTAPFLLRASTSNHPEQIAQPSETWHFVEIPKDFAAIRDTDRATALDWKLAVRETLHPAFEQGYRAVDFIRHAGRNWYALQRMT